jgi:hypothetical protein
VHISLLDRDTQTEESEVVVIGGENWSLCVVEELEDDVDFVRGAMVFLYQYSSVLVLNRIGDWPEGTVVVVLMYNVGIAR